MSRAGLSCAFPLFWFFVGAVGGDETTDEDKEKAEEEERERLEAIREAEDRRKEKHRKMEEEREKMRQEIRDKVSAMNNFYFILCATLMRVTLIIFWMHNSFFLGSYNKFLRAPHSFYCLRIFLIVRVSYLAKNNNFHPAIN